MFLARTVAKASLLSLVLLLPAPDVLAQFTQCQSYYNLQENQCLECVGDTRGVGKRTWRNFGNYCVTCQLNCPLFARAAKGAHQDGAACQPQLTDNAAESMFIALDPEDKAIDTLSRRHLAAAQILTAMFPNDAGITPIDWASGQIPFSSLPSRPAYDLQRQGLTPGSGVSRQLAGGLISTYITERTNDGYLVSFVFHADPLPSGKSIYSTLGGRRVDVRLQEVNGESFADLGQKVVLVPLHRILSAEIDGQSVKF